MNQEELNQRIDDGEMNFDYEDLSGLILSWQDLSGFTFRQSILLETDFSNSDMRYASFREAQMQGTIFSRTDLRYADFCYTYLSETDLRFTFLYGANFYNAVGVPAWVLRVI